MRLYKRDNYQFQDATRSNQFKWNKTSFTKILYQLWFMFIKKVYLKLKSITTSNIRDPNLHQTTVSGRIELWTTNSKLHTMYRPSFSNLKPLQNLTHPPNHDSTTLQPNSEASAPHRSRHPRAHPNQTQIWIHHGTEYLSSSSSLDNHNSMVGGRQRCYFWPVDRRRPLLVAAAASREPELIYFGHQRCGRWVFLS